MANVTETSASVIPVTSDFNITEFYGNGTSAETPKEINTYISDKFLSDAKFVIYVLLVPVLCTSGIVGNSLALGIFLDMARRTKQTIYTYMLALVLVDSLILLVSMGRAIPFIVGVFDESSGQFWQAHTLIPIIFFDLGLSTMNSMILILMSTDRLVAVTAPISARKTSLAKHPIRFITVAACFVILAVLPLPVSLQLSSSVGQNDTVVYEVVSRESIDQSFHSFVLLESTVLVYLPYVLLVILNIAISAQYASVTRKRLRVFSQTTFQNSSETQLRVNATISIIIFMYTVLNLPQMFIQTLAIVDETFSINGEEANLFWFLTDVTNILIIVNSSIDFVIYVFRFDSCRKRFKEKFCRIDTSVQIDQTEETFSSLPI